MEAAFLSRATPRPSGGRAFESLLCLCIGLRCILHSRSFATWASHYFCLVAAAVQLWTNEGSDPVLDVRCSRLLICRRLHLVKMFHTPLHQPSRALGGNCTNASLFCSDKEGKGQWRQHLHASGVRLFLLPALGRRRSLSPLLFPVPRAAVLLLL